MTREQLFQAILDRLGHAEIAKAKTLIGSKTLRDAIQLIVTANEGRAVLFIPHYWAEYYHDGRGPAVPVTASMLVFYADPSDDPRLVGGFPVRASDIQKLSPDDYRRGLEINAERRKAGGTPFMYVVPRSPLLGDRVDGSPFFDVLAQDAAARADTIVLDEFDSFIQDFVDTDPDVKGETATAVLEF